MAILKGGGVYYRTFWVATYCATTYAENLKFGNYIHSTFIFHLKQVLSP